MLFGEILRQEPPWNSMLYTGLADSWAKPFLPLTYVRIQYTRHRFRGARKLRKKGYLFAYTHSQIRIVDEEENDESTTPLRSRDEQTATSEIQIDVNALWRERNHGRSDVSYAKFLMATLAKENFILRQLEFLESQKRHYSERRSRRWSGHPQFLWKGIRGHMEGSSASKAFTWPCIEIWLWSWCIGFQTYSTQRL